MSSDDPAVAGANDASVPAPSERLRFHRWRPEDAEEASLMYGDPEVVRFIGGSHEPDLESMVKKVAFLIERTASLPPGQGSFPVRARDDDRFVGVALIKPLPGEDERPTDHIEIGWHVMRREWGRGVAPEMGRALCRYAFEVLRLTDLHAVVDPQNVRSVAVARKVGLVHRGQTSAYYGGKVLEHFTLDATCWRDRAAG